MEYLSIIRSGMYGDAAWEFMRGLCRELRRESNNGGRAADLGCMLEYRAPDGEVCLKLDYGLSGVLESMFFRSRWRRLDWKGAREKLARVAVKTWFPGLDGFGPDAAKAFSSILLGRIPKDKKLHAEFAGTPRNEIETELKALYRKERAWIYMDLNLKLESNGVWIRFRTDGLNEERVRAYLGVHPIRDCLERRVLAELDARLASLDMKFGRGPGYGTEDMA